MFIFMDTLTKLQAITYVKLRSTNAEAVCTRKELEKEQFLIEKYSKWMSGGPLLVLLTNDGTSEQCR
jgi:hypothetical protein